MGSHIYPARVYTELADMERMYAELWEMAQGDSDIAREAAGAAAAVVALQSGYDNVLQWIEAWGNDLALVREDFGMEEA